MPVWYKERRKHRGCSRSSITLSFYPSRSKLCLFSVRAEGSERYRVIFKIAIFGHQTWPLIKVPEVAHLLSFCPTPQPHPRGAKLNLHVLSLYGLRFPKYKDFQNFHIWASNLAIGRTWEVTHTDCFYPRGSKLTLFSRYKQRFPKYRPVFKMPHLGMKLGH